MKVHGRCVSFSNGVFSEGELCWELLGYQNGGEGPSAAIVVSPFKTPGLEDVSLAGQARRG